MREKSLIFCMPKTPIVGLALYYVAYLVRLGRGSCPLTSKTFDIVFSIAAFSVASLLTMIVTTSGREAAFWLLLLPPPSSISVIDRPSLDTHSAPLIASKRIFCVQKNLLDVKAFLLKPYTFIYKYIAVVGPFKKSV